MDLQYGLEHMPSWVFPPLHHGCFHAKTKQKVMNIIGNNSTTSTSCGKLQYLLKIFQIFLESNFCKAMTSNLSPLLCAWVYLNILFSILYLATQDRIRRTFEKKQYKIPHYSLCLFKLGVKFIQTLSYFVLNWTEKRTGSKKINISMGKYYSIFAGARSSNMHKFIIIIKIMQKIWREWVRDLSIYLLSVCLPIYQSINPDIKIHKDIKILRIIYQPPSSCAPLACCTHSCKEGRWDD